MLRSYLFAYLLLLVNNSIGQLAISTDLHPPLDIPIQFSSNFGSLRNNHFHMGLDFRTQQRTGLKMYSVAEGYVSRVKFTTNGYGNVIYIDHPGGFTSVYAHCSSFVGKIDSLVTLEQFLQSKVEIELFPEPGSISIKKGEWIALSGNTGHSGGPHLHFEIRDTKTETAINPLLFGFKQVDNRAPELRTVKVYALSEEAYAIADRSVERKFTYSVNGYQITGNKIRLPATFLSGSSGIGLAFDVVDRMNGSQFDFGIYRSELFVNEALVFSVRFDSISFDDSRFVNTYTDYTDLNQTKKRYHRNFKSDENQLSIYSDALRSGLITLNPGDSVLIRYRVFDFVGNESNSLFWVQIDPGVYELNHSNPNTNMMHPDSCYYFVHDSVSIFCPPRTVFEPVSLPLTTKKRELLSAKHPVNEPFIIRYPKPSNYAGKDYIRISNPGMSPKNLIPIAESDMLCVESKYFGQFELRRDTTAPKIVPFNIPQDSAKADVIELCWIISDTECGIGSYDFYINGEWQICRYEHKDNSLRCTLPSGCVGDLQFQLKVRDSCKNESIWEKRVFLRSEFESMTKQK